ncbi:hypothetical protein BOX15_Mlig031575g2, partial [Macrostomum lignano]
CPSSVPNCKPSYRCVYFNLENVGSSNRQIFNGHCENTLLPPICYAPEGGTDKFDQIPMGSATVNGLVSLTVAGLVSSLMAKLL